MKKGMALLALLALMACSDMHARRYHRGYRGYRGYGYGFGPAVGVSYSVPIGGGYKGPKQPAAVQQFVSLHGYTPSPRQFCKWAQSYFVPGKAEQVCNEYQAYINTPPRYSPPKGYFSFGVGGGGGYPYWGW